MKKYLVSLRRSSSPGAHACRLGLPFALQPVRPSHGIRHEFAHELCVSQIVVSLGAHILRAAMCQPGKAKNGVCVCV